MTSVRSSQERNPGAVGYNRCVQSIRRLFHNPAIPHEYRRNFIHLYLDIAWFGVLSGSAIGFLNIFAARLGANGFQIGLLGAVPAMVSLFLSIPAGKWLSKRPVDRAVFWSAAVARLGYLFWVPLPLFFGNQGQIWALVAITLAMGIPMCGLNVGFNALFAAAVPGEWRASVAGRRNALLALTYIISSLGSGYLLEHMRFPVGYQVVFAIGFFGAAMSTLHLFLIRPQAAPTESMVRAEKPEEARRDWRGSLRMDIWKTPFRNTLLVFMGLHFGQYLALPLFPLYTVNVMKLSDGNIGIGTAIFYLAVLLGSTQLNRLERRWGHHKITGWGVIGMCLYPVMMAFSRTPSAYYFLSAVGGAVWALVGGAYANYLLERIPENDRPSYLAWYNLVLNASVLSASLLGPVIAGWIGLSLALVLVGILRLISGAAVLKWG
jgi:MFS family permease